MWIFPLDLNPQILSRFPCGKKIFLWKTTNNWLLCSVADDNLNERSMWQEGNFAHFCPFVDGDVSVKLQKPWWAGAKILPQFLWPLHSSSIDENTLLIPQVSMSCLFFFGFLRTNSFGKMLTDTCAKIWLCLRRNVLPQHVSRPCRWQSGLVRTVKLLWTQHTSYFWFLSDPESLQNIQSTHIQFQFFRWERDQQLVKNNVI